MTLRHAALVPAGAVWCGDRPVRRTVARAEGRRLSGRIFWWSVVRGRCGRAGYGVSALAVFLTARRTRREPA